MKKEASITLVPSGQEWAVIRKGGCGHGIVTLTVPDTSPGAKPGATRSEQGPCNCGGA